MPRVTVPYARNIMRRAFFEVIDPPPSTSEIRRLWKHFESKCAYCGRPLISGEKQAHIDHLVASSAGGRNHIANRVLACAACNENEKREMPWLDFLKQKVQSGPELEQRRRRIEDWLAQFDPAETVLPSDLHALATACADEATQAFSLQIERLRSAKDQMLRTNS